MGATIYADYCTHLGNIRKNNEDNLFCNGIFLNKNTCFAEDARRFNEKMQLYALCDGMGGGPQGEEASYIAVSRLQSLLEKLKAGNAVRESIDQYVYDINNTIVSICSEGHAGSTIVMLALCDGVAAVVHLGDSRVYLYRNGRLLCLTEDHTEEQRLKNLGIAGEYTAVHKNILTRYLGMNMKDLVIRPTYSSEIRTQQGDLFLLCSDGLTGMLAEAEIESILEGKNAASARELVNAAIKNGGLDNVTVVAVRVE